MNAMLNIAEAHPYLCWLMAQLRIAFRNVFKICYKIFFFSCCLQEDCEEDLQLMKYFFVLLNSGELLLRCKFLILPFPFFHPCTTRKNYDSKLKYSQTVKLCGWADSEAKAEKFSF